MRLACRFLAAVLIPLSCALLAAPSLAAAGQSLGDQAATNYLRAAAVPLQSGDLAEAARILEEGLDRSPGSPEMLTMLAEVYHGQGRLDAAADAADEALTMEPGYAPAHLRLGDVYRDLGLLNSAADRYRAALRADRQAAAARGRLVHCLVAAGELARAESRCREFLAEAETARLYLALAAALQGQERSQEALAALDRAVAIEPRSADAHAERAGLLCRLGEHEAAMEASRTALGIDADHAVAHRWLAVASAEREDFMGAYGHAVRAQKAGLDMSDVWATLQRER
jgi:tetratricopeptide (TPR) repeat protein